MYFRNTYFSFYKALIKIKLWASKFTAIHLRTLFVYFLIYFINVTHVSASEILDIDELLLVAQEKNLSKSKQWLRLLHFNQGGTIHSKNSSYVKSSDFFLSPNGNINPEAELVENIKQFFDTKHINISIQASSKRTNPYCQFPARFHWLSEQLSIHDFDERLSHCNEFMASKKTMAAKKVVLVFPSAYLNNPSSIFGHTLLRIDGKLEESNAILSWAINFGANFDKDDSALSYAAKGVSGEYPGQYFVVSYSQKIKEYGQIENRDIWEFPLALSESEVDFLIKHLWELKNVQFDYYYFDENCSFRLLELIEVAKPELELSKKFRLAELPINTVKAFDDINLIENTIFRPSKERQLRKQLKSLTRKQKRIIQDLSMNPNLAKEESFKQLNDGEKLQLLEVAYHYLRFKQSQTKRNSLSAKNSLELLKSINQYSLTTKRKVVGISSNEESIKAIIESLSILKSHDSQRLGFSLEGNAAKRFYGIEYRMAYHDYLDNAISFPSGASIEGPSIKIKQSDSKHYIDKIALFEISSLNPINELRRDFSWSIGVKAERDDEKNQNLHSIAEAGAGLSVQLNSIIFYQLLIPRIELSPESKNTIDLGADFKIGMLINLQKHPFSIETRVLKLKNQSHKSFLNLSQQIELSKNQGLRLEYNYFEKNNDDNKTARMTYFMYF